MICAKDLSTFIGRPEGFVALALTLALTLTPTLALTHNLNLTLPVGCAAGCVAGLGLGRGRGWGARMGVAGGVLMGGGDPHLSTHFGRSVRSSLLPLREERGAADRCVTTVTGDTGSVMSVTRCRPLCGYAVTGAKRF